MLWSGKLNMMVARRCTGCEHLSVSAAIRREKSLGEGRICNYLALPFATVNTGDGGQFPGYCMLGTGMTGCFPIDTDGLTTLLIPVLRHWMMMIQHGLSKENRTLALGPGFLPRSWPRDTYISVIVSELGFRSASDAEFRASEDA